MNDSRTKQRHAVVAVVLQAGKVLVIQRGPGVINPGYWTPPSGRIEPGEDQPEAVVREVQEEVGLLVRPLAKVWECDTHDGQFRLHWWTAAATSTELVCDPVEVGAAQWIRPEEFVDLSPTFAGDLVFFTEVLPSLLPLSGE